MTVYVGMDLHSTNTYVAMIDAENKALYKHRHRNDLSHIVSALEPYREQIGGIVVESTYNWYWLVDGLMDEGFQVHLANPSAIKQYEGLKSVDDKRSALWLANLLRLGILPTGYIYPKEERPIRDLLRKRLHLVRHRTSHILSVKNILSRSLGLQMKSDEVKKLDASQVERLFPRRESFRAVMASVGLITHFKEEIDGIETIVRRELKLKEGFGKLLAVPGIGDILSMTVMCEAGDMRRFPTVQNYSSYCRCVKSIRSSNGKIIGHGNRKNGNKYLSWAYIEAAHAARRYHEKIRSYYERKAAQTNKVVATKALAHKLARASYFVVRDNVDYDEARLF
jgi:transposase